MEEQPTQPVQEPAITETPPAVVNQPAEVVNKVVTPEPTLEELCNLFEEEDEYVKEVKTKDPNAKIIRDPVTGRILRGVAQQTNKNGKTGRPTVMTELVLRDLRKAFLMGFSDQEACAYAKISRQTFVNYQNSHPEFIDKKEEWQQNPILKAKTTLYKSLGNSPQAAWYLERKLKHEFALRTEHTGPDGGAIAIELDKMESDYADVGARAAAAIASTTARPAIEGQVVAANPPIQDQGQAGQPSDVQTELPTTETPSGEVIPPVQPDPQV